MRYPFFFSFPFRKPSFSWPFRVLCLRRSLRNCTACLFLHDLPPICALPFRGGIMKQNERRVEGPIKYQS
jgi:hypothetical protein